MMKKSSRNGWGACRNSFDPEYLSGGSSAGSAVAVALGLVTFALGTDTAGSGRIPAAFNNIGEYCRPRLIYLFLAQFHHRLFRLCAQTGMSRTLFDHLARAYR
jgi:hypothetical protein